MTRDLPDCGRTAARWRRQRRMGVLGCLLACWLGMQSPATAQPTTPETTVKAAFVFNFLRFTEWPAQRLAARDTPLRLCVWSADARLSESLKALAGRSVDERPVRVTDIDRPEEVGKCHAVFVADAPGRGFPSAWLHKAGSMDVLTLGDGDGFAASGGMIGLVADGARMRFEINDKAVKRGGLKLGSQLYQLGRSVAEGPAK